MTRRRCNNSSTLCAQGVGYRLKRSVLCVRVQMIEPSLNIGTPPAAPAGLTNTMRLRRLTRRRRRRSITCYIDWCFFHLLKRRRSRARACPVQSPFHPARRLAHHPFNRIVFEKNKIKITSSAAAPPDVQRRSILPPTFLYGPRKAIIMFESYR